MSDGITIHIDGLKEMDEAFDRLKDPARVKRIIRKALREGALLEQAAMVERAPIRPNLPSGNALPVGAMKMDIAIRSSTDEDGNLSSVIGPGKATARQANWVEYGHALVAGGYSKLGKNGKRRGPGKVVGQVPAHPWIRPAFESSETAVTDAIVESLRVSAADIEDKT